SIDALNVAHKDQSSLESRREYCAKLADILQSELDDLGDVQWPGDTAVDAKAFVATAGVVIADARSCATASDPLMWTSDLEWANKDGAKAQAAAAALRLDLHLPAPSDSP